MAPKKSKNLTWWFTGVTVTALAVSATWFFCASFETSRPFSSNLFSPNFPQSERFQKEIAELKSSGALGINEEKLIGQSIAATSARLQIPEALLWCLLFQESRFNHLAGIDGYGGATGLGQFSSYSFYEVNHQLERYHRNPSALVASLLGTDVRPIEARRTEILHPSSYFNIRTAVAASALYLKNRKLHLERTLDSHQLRADQDLIWLWAAVAYNKGTRAVLSIFNQLQRKGGKVPVENLVRSLASFESITQDSSLLNASLRRIWPPAEAERFARELRVHAGNILECSVRPEVRR